MNHPGLPRCAASVVLLLVVSAAGLSAAGIPVSGRVRAGDEQVLSRTEVVLEPIRSAYDRVRLRLAGESGPEAADRGRLAGDGSFALTAPEIGMWTVVVSAPGRLPMEHHLVPLVDAVQLPDLDLPPAVELEVRVADAAGRPIAAAVAATSYGVSDPSEHGGWRPRPRLASAGADGVARLPAGRGEALRIEALAAGHPVAVADVAGDSYASLTLAAGVAGTVRVTDHRQRPLAGALAVQGSGFLPLGLSDAQGRLPLVLAATEPPPVRVWTSQGWNGSFEIDLGAAGATVRQLRLTPPTQLRGRVLEAGGRDPVADALVWAFPGEVAVTDARGGYELQLPGLERPELLAAASGYLRGGAALRRGVADGPTLFLTPAAAVSGGVVDADGEPVAEVAVTAVFAPGFGSAGPAPYNRRYRWQARTSRHGAFRVPGLLAAASYLLVFEKPGFAPGRLAVNALGRFEERSGLEVVLRRGRLGVGRVVDEAEQPVAGAGVTLRRPAATQTVQQLWLTPRSETDGEGRFQVPDLAAGRYDLEVAADGFAPARVPGLPVPEGAGELDFGTVVLVPGARLEGRVSDPHRAPIADAEIALHLEGAMAPSSLRGEATSDAEGNFTVTDLLPHQPVRLSVRAAGFGSAALSAVRPPTAEPIEIVLQPAGSIAGRVVDTAGRAIEAARLAAQPERPTPATSRSPTTAHSDADGRFQLADLEPVAQRLEVSAPSYQRQVLWGLEVAAGGERHVEIVLEPGAVVEGRLTTEDDAPVAQASVGVEPARDPTAGVTATTDADGRYRLDGVALGPAAISVRYRERDCLRQQVEVEPGTNSVDLRLESGFEISGRVVDPENHPVAGARLWLRQTRHVGRIYRQEPQAVSAADGSFTLADVAAGGYWLTAAQEGFVEAHSERFEVGGDVAGVELALSRGAMLTGEVLNLDFDEMGALAISAFNERSSRRARIDVSGRYAVDRLSPGVWKVRGDVAGAGRSGILRIVEVPEGVAEVHQDLDFGTGFTLSGVVVENGEPLAGAHVAAASTAGLGETTTDAAGGFRIDRLQAGSYQLRVASSSATLHVQAFELASDHEMRIELATDGLTGIVLDAVSGEPLAGFRLSLERLDAPAAASVYRQPSFRWARSGSRGRFRVERLRPGSWRIVATGPGYAAAETTVAVTAGVPPSGVTPEVEIRMTPTEGVSFGAVAEGGAVAGVSAAIVDPAGRAHYGGFHRVVDGRVSVTTVPPGRWELLLQAGESAVTRFAVTAPGDQGHVSLPLGGSLRFAVDELADVLAARLVLSGPDGKPFIHPRALHLAPGERTLTQGRALLSHLAPGVWSYTVLHPDGRSWSGSATVTPGSTTEVRPSPAG